MKNHNKHIKNQKGQVLLFVVVAMTIALALGIGVSLQTISNISSVSQADTTQRALAAAEGGAERALTLNDAALGQLVGDAAANCANLLNGSYNATTQECVINFSAGTDNITTQAGVKVATFAYTYILNPGNNFMNSRYEFLLAPNATKEVNLVEYGSNAFRLCWDDAGVADLYYTIYNASGDVRKNYVSCSGTSASGNFQTTPCAAGNFIGEINTATAASGFNSCYTVTSVTSAPLGVRVSVLGATTPIRAAFVDTRNNTFLGPQGYKITSTGKLQNSDDVKKVINIYKSFPYALPMFDFGIFGNSGVSTQ